MVDPFQVLDNGCCNNTTSTTSPPPPPPILLPTRTTSSAADARPANKPAAVAQVQLIPAAANGAPTADNIAMSEFTPAAEQQLRLGKPTDGGVVLLHSIVDKPPAAAIQTQQRTSRRTAAQSLRTAAAAVEARNQAAAAAALAAGGGVLLDHTEPHSRDSVSKAAIPAAATTTNTTTSSSSSSTTLMGGPTTTVHGGNDNEIGSVVVLAPGLGVQPQLLAMPTPTTTTSKSHLADRLNGLSNHNHHHHNNNHNNATGAGTAAATVTTRTKVNNHHTNHTTANTVDEVVVVSSSASSSSSSSSSTSSRSSFASLSPASSSSSSSSALSPPKNNHNPMAAALVVAPPPPLLAAAVRGAAIIKEPSAASHPRPSTSSATTINLTRHESLQSTLSSSSYASGSSSAASSPASGTDEPSSAAAVAAGAVALSATTMPSHNHHHHLNNHYHSQHNHSSSPTSTTVDVEDTRKVEPLKIQLLQHREPIKTVIKLANNVYDSAAVTLSPSSSSNTPKITIKPIPRPVDQADDSATITATTSHRLDLSGAAATAHIVPKLTIRTATAGAQSEIVPKLTIAYNHVNNSIGSDNGSAIADKPPPIPKMTIKANEIVQNSSSTPAPTTPSSRSAQQSMGDNSHSTSPAVPKIKIKQISNPEESSAAATFTISRSDDDDHSPVKRSSPPTVPKLLVRVPKAEDAAASDVPEVPKLTIRQVNSGSNVTNSVTLSDSIVIPKVTIKPIINPDAPAENEPATLVTPKITIKPIPRPGLDLTQPLEVITSGGSADFVSSIPDMLSTASGGQQSPRIILKINKASKEMSATSSTKLQQQPQPNNSTTDHVDHVVAHTSGDLKRANASGSSHVAPEAKRARVEEAAAKQQSVIMPVESKLKEILSRMTSNATTPQQSAATTAAVGCTDLTSPDATQTPRKYQTNSSVRRPIRPPPSAQSDNAIQLPPEMELAAKMFREEPITQPVRLHPLLLQNIERAKLLEAMMNAGGSNETTANASANDGVVTATMLTMCSEGSSSDCILVEDAGTAGLDGGAVAAGGAATTSVGTHPFASVSVKANGPSDQDSGVDVSGSTASGGSTGSGGGGADKALDAFGGSTPATKRGRGRPRKEAAAELLSAKKIKEEKLAKRRFVGLLNPERKTPGRKRKSAVAVDAVCTDVDAPPSSATAASAASILGANSNTNSNLSTGSSSTQTVQSGSLHHHDMDDEVVLLVEDASSSSQMKPDGDPLTAVDPLANTDSVADSTAVGADVGTPTVKSVVKERKRRIRIDDDDESPTFNPLGPRTTPGMRVRGRGRGGRGSRGGGMGRLSTTGVQRTVKGVPVLEGNGGGTAAAESAFRLVTPEKSLDNGVVFMSPDEKMFTSPPEGKNQRKQIFREATVFTSPTAPVLQAFEDDTRMSADCFTTPLRNVDHLHNDESQNSLLSTASTSVAATSEGGGGAGGTAIKKRGKIEVSAPEGKIEFTCDMIAEYDWPPPKGCCPSRQRDTFMIQEQVAEYLGVKSFKRKYPDLPRRMVEMEERNYLSEKGLVSEKMCDLGLTAVMASDVLDIMHNDFFEKYDEYKKFLSVKHIRQLTSRSKAATQAEALERNLSAREHAMHAAATWNREFNRERLDERRQCLDMQTFVVHHPEADRRRMTVSASMQETPSHYPIALVPGQFQEFYRNFSAAELLCYPINSALADPLELDRKLRNLTSHQLAIIDSSEESSSSSDSDNDSSSDSDSDSDDTSDSDSDAAPTLPRLLSGRTATTLAKSSTSSASVATAPTKTSIAQTTIRTAAAGSALVTGAAKAATTAAASAATACRPDGSMCRVCDRPQNVNRDNKPEVFVMCSTCRRRAHPSCIEMPPRMSLRVQDYDWQCSECKHCSKCRQNTNEDKMLFCDQCDRGYHIYCIGLRGVPDGRWHCPVCSICTLCGTRSPEGHKNPNLTAKQRQRLISTAKWSHEYRISHVSNLREHSAMLCTPCAQQRSAERTDAASVATTPTATGFSPSPSGSAGSSYTTILSPMPPSPVAAGQQQQALVVDQRPATPRLSGRSGATT